MRQCAYFRDVYAYTEHMEPTTTMAIPDYESLMLPLLRLSADGSVHKFSDAVEILADEHGLSDEERTELLPSGAQPVFRNRVGWAKSYMKQAGLLAFPKRGYSR